MISTVDAIKKSAEYVKGYVDENFAKSIKIKTELSNTSSLEEFKNKNNISMNIDSEDNNNICFITSGKNIAEEFNGINLSTSSSTLTMEYIDTSGVLINGIDDSNSIAAFLAKNGVDSINIDCSEDDTISMYALSTDPSIIVVMQARYSGGQEQMYANAKPVTSKIITGKKITSVRCYPQVPKGHACNNARVYFFVFKNEVPIYSYIKDIDIDFNNYSSISTYPYKHTLSSITDIKEYIDSKNVGISGKFDTANINGKSIIVNDSISGKVINGNCENQVTVSGLNLCDAGSVKFTTYKTIKLPKTYQPGWYTLSFEIYTDANPMNGGSGILYYLGNSTGRRLTNFNSGERATDRVNVSSEFDTITFYSSYDAFPSKGYVAEWKNIMIVSGYTDKFTYEKYIDTCVYDNANDIILTEDVNNIITSSSIINIEYIKKNSFIDSLLSQVGGIESLDYKLLGYVTPEMFGAIGDDINDDTEALQTCINFASENNYRLIGNKNYRTSSTINISGINLNFDINSITNTSNNTAVILDTVDSNINIQHIISNGDGLKIHPVIYLVRNNLYSIHIIESKKNAFVIVSDTKDTQSCRVIFEHFKSGGDGYYGVSSIQSDNRYVGEYTFIGGQISNAEWGVYGLIDARFENIQFEENIGGGYWLFKPMGCTIFYDRHAESARDGSKPFIKLGNNDIEYSDYSNIVGDSRFYYHGNYLNINEIDVSEMKSKYYLSNGTLSPINSSSYGNLFCKIGSAYIETGSNETNYAGELAETAILWGNKIILKPDGRKIERDITVDFDNRNNDITLYTLPSIFNIKNDVTLRLHPSYCFIGYNKFIVNQNYGYTAIIYDYDGRLVFDGSQLGQGSFEVSHIVKTNKTVGFDMTGAEWTVTPLSSTVTEITKSEFDSMKNEIENLKLAIIALGGSV